MKTINSIVLAIVICVSLTACGGGGSEAPYVPPAPMYDITGNWDMWADSYYYDCNNAELMDDVEEYAKGLFEEAKYASRIKMVQEGDTWYGVDDDNIRIEGTVVGNEYTYHDVRDIEFENGIIVYADITMTIYLNESGWGDFEVRQYYTRNIDNLEYEIELFGFITPVEED